MNFRIGQQVVCVDAGPDRFGQPAKLIERQIYTVRKIGDGVFLFETTANYEHRGAGFHFRRFRPVKETDISIFTAMLAPTPKQKVRA